MRFKERSVCLVACGKAVFVCQVKMLSEKTVVFDKEKLMRTVARISHEIVERNTDLNNVVLVGVLRRGVSFAKRIGDYVAQFEGVVIPQGNLDITLYRDDLTKLSVDPQVKKADIGVSVEGKDVIICDDVIYTGRTARAAIDAVISYGRPKTIQLAVVVDRGHRELPIRPDYVGKNVPTAKSEVIAVKFEDYDGVDGVTICDID